MKKIAVIFLNALPILIMIGLIPLVANDYVLASIYIVIIAAALIVKKTPHDPLMLVFGFLTMTTAEYLFISTGVETFQRKTLLGVMPVWLPVLWAYGFVAIKRSVKVLARYS